MEAQELGESSIVQFKEQLDELARLPRNGGSLYAEEQLIHGTSIDDVDIVNALVHRDYFISSTIKVFIYSDRVEIISPGKLPNSLTVENIKNGVSIARNPILLSIAQYVLPYKGLGTGIIRSYTLYPEIIMENRITENIFVVTIKRPQ